MNREPIKVLLLSPSLDVEAQVGDCLEDAAGQGTWQLEVALDYDTARHSLANGEYDACLVDCHCNGKGRRQFLQQNLSRCMPILVLCGHHANHHCSDVSADIPSTEALEPESAVGDITFDPKKDAAETRNYKTPDVEALQQGAADYLWLEELTPGLLQRAIRYAIERKRAQNTLREVTRFNEEVISSAGEGIVVYDRQLRYVLWNPFMEQLTGLGRDEVLGRCALDVFPHLREHGIDQLLQRALEGHRTHTGDVHFVAPQTGRSGWVQSTYEPHRDGQGEIVGVIGVITDVTERKRVEDALRESEERFRSLLENGLDIITVFDAAGFIRYGSPSLQRIIGGATGDMIGKGVFDLVHPDDAALLKEATARLLDTRDAMTSIEMRLRHADGSWRMMEATCRNMIDDPIVGGIVVNARDITHRKQTEAQLIFEALHDQLTALPNRTLFMDRLGQAIERARRRESTLFAVLFVDFDRFKVINDSLGHMAGDELLIAVARRLEGCLRPGDTVARLGGDEFALLLEEITNVGDAVYVAERIQRELRRPFPLARQEVFTAASIGIALGGSPPLANAYERPEDLLRDADMAMYRAKERGRARHEIFDTGMHAQAVTRLQLETDLRCGLERGEFQLHYQPIITLQSGSITGFEALVRWNHPERGLVLPDQFIPVAEDTGLIVPIGWWVLRESCHQLRRWMDEFKATRNGEPSLTMGVNLSSKQFCQSDLVARIKDVLRETRLSPHNLKLEITESVLMEVDTVTERLLQLRDLGVQLGIDDFGTGYSSLSYLHRFPIHALKIDRSFVSRMGDRNNLEIVKTIVALAQNLRMTVVAEGVETEEQLGQLRAMECDFGQGFLFSQPLDKAAAQTLIAARKQW